MNYALKIFLVLTEILPQIADTGLPKIDTHLKKVSNFSRWPRLFCHLKSLFFVFSSTTTHIRKGSCAFRIFIFIYKIIGVGLTPKLRGGTNGLLRGNWHLGADLNPLWLF